MKRSSGPPGRVMFSVNEGSFGMAARELRDVFGRDLDVERVGADLGVLGGTRPTVNEVASACGRRQLVFIRHLTVEVCRIGLAEAADPDAVVAVARSAISEQPVGRELAVQTWVSDSAQLGYGSAELFSQLARGLEDDGLSVSRAGKAHVLSACITPKGVSVGLNRAAESLSDWPGGRVRLSRGKAQVSRAEFKLEELFGTFSIDLPAEGRAVDFGASPGGWTRILRQRGLDVWAVDPGDLDPRIAADGHVRHVRTTVGEFLRSTDMVFDLAVNDMRMDPLMSCQVMLDAASQLRPGAPVIVTLKTGTQRPVETVRRCVELLDRSYVLTHARQLHHNRQEVTVVAHRKAPRQTRDFAPGR